LLLDPKIPRYRPAYFESDNLPDKRKKYNMISDEHEIEVTFLIALIIWGRLRDWVRNEQEG